MNLLRLIISITLLLQYTASVAATCNIRGRIIPKVSDTEWTQKVYLSRMESVSDFFRCSPSLVVDSAVIRKDGSFEFRSVKGIEPNTFYRLEVVPKDYKGGSMLNFSGIDDNYAFLLLSPGSQISFTTELAHFNYAFNPVKLDKANLALRKVVQMAWPADKAIAVIIARRKKLEDMPGTPPDTLKNLRAEVSELINKHAVEMLPVIDTLSNPYVSLFTFITNFSEDSLFCLKMNSRYQREIPKSKYSGQFLDMIYDMLYTLPIGSKAPDVSLPDSSGKIISTAGLRGKYVIIDFWGSWCHPCRMENQQVIKPLYGKYGSRNFYILSISLDTDRDTWLSALRKDELNWPGEVCDLKGIKSAAALAYKVTDLPVAYVLDPSGTIIAKNLRGKQLDDFIAARMDKK